MYCISVSNPRYALLEVIRSKINYIASLLNRGIYLNRTRGVLRTISVLRLPPRSIFKVHVEKKIFYTV